MIRRHLPNVLTYLRHRITNAGLEAVNATIQWVKRTARGFRNAEHFKTAITSTVGGWIFTHTKAGRATLFSAGMRTWAFLPATCLHLESAASGIQVGRPVISRLPASVRV